MDTHPDDVLPPVIGYELAEAGREGRARLEARPQRDGTVLWGIFEDTRTCLIGPGEWACEPMPSNKDDEYLALARRSFEDRLALWRRHLLVACSGGTFRRWVARNATAEACDRLHDPWGIAALCGIPEGPGRAWDWVEAAAPLMPGDPRFAPPDLDCAVRGAVALLWDAHRGGFALAGDDTLLPEAAEALRERLPDDARGDLPRLTAAVRADLGRRIDAAGPMRVGPVRLVAAGGAIAAEPVAAAP